MLNLAQRELRHGKFKSNVNFQTKIDSLVIFDVVALVIVILQELLEPLGVVLPLLLLEPVLLPLLLVLLGLPPLPRLPGPAKATNSRSTQDKTSRVPPQPLLVGRLLLPGPALRLLLLLRLLLHLLLPQQVPAALLVVPLPVPLPFPLPLAFPFPLSLPVAFPFSLLLAFPLPVPLAFSLPLPFAFSVAFPLPAPLVRSGIRTMWVTE